MKLTFVGHASVIFDVGEVSLWTDPWLKGVAINESWALYPQPILRDEDLARSHMRGSRMSTQITFA